MSDDVLTSFDPASQHGPRPLPLFLAMLRSETATSGARRTAALAGLRAYQAAPRTAPPPPRPAVAAAGRARLRDYGGRGWPVVFVPSLINPPQVLDLARGRSLLRWLARQGVRPLLVDWGCPDVAARGQDIDAHVTDLLLPLLRSLPRPPILVGYCLGGTIATAAAALHPVAGLATIAAPWHFSAYGDAAAPISTMWDQAQPVCEVLGLVPMEVLQSGFWQIDPGRTVAKFERFGRLSPRSAAARSFVVLEDWANAGAPLTYAAGRQLFDDFYAADLPGRGGWRIGETVIDPATIAVPRIAFASTADRIVPAATTAACPDTRQLAIGHVGMIVGSHARDALWAPLADWLRQVARSRTRADRF